MKPHYSNNWIADPYYIALNHCKSTPRGISAISAYKSGDPFNVHHIISHQMIFALKWFIHTKYFVLPYSIDIVSSLSYQFTSYGKPHSCRISISSVCLFLNYVKSTTLRFFVLCSLFGNYDTVENGVMGERICDLHQNRFPRKTPILQQVSWHCGH